MGRLCTRVERSQATSLRGNPGRRGTSSGDISCYFEHEPPDIDAISSITILATFATFIRSEQPSQSQPKPVLSAPNARGWVVHEPKFKPRFCCFTGFNARPNARQIQPKTLSVFWARGASIWFPFHVSATTITWGLVTAANVTSARSAPRWISIFA